MVGACVAGVSVAGQDGRVRLYAPALAKYPELTRRRSAVRTAIAGAIIVVAVAAIAYTVPNFIDLAEQGRENAQDASRARYRFGGGFLPVAIIVLAAGAAIAAIVALFGTGTHVWVRSASGAVLRKRFEGYHAMSVEQFEHLHAAFATGDPVAYTPLPDQVRRGSGVVLIWTADADRCGYVGLTWGADARTTRNAPLIRLEGERFDRLDEALRRGLRRPAPRPSPATPPESVPAASPAPAPASPTEPAPPIAPQPALSDATEPNPARIYALASNRLDWQPGDPFVYPYAVDLRWDEQRWRVEMSEGVTFSAVAAIVSVDEALSPAWAAHLAKAEAGWLRPYLERIAAGEDVTGDELVAAFEARHHRPLNG
ncbi:MAG: hypothetical protein K0S37_4704 [Microbacterium sp.]|nr:hypothetical protein [Microbacterium sp.]